MNKQIRLIQAFALGMAVLSVPTLATAVTSVDVVDASILARGAGVLVSIEVTCDPSFGPGSHLFANVTLFQRAGNRVTQSSRDISDVPINCDGTPQTFEILVPSSGRAFRPGPVIAAVAETVCDPFFNICEFAQFVEEIDIVRDNK